MINVITKTYKLAKYILRVFLNKLSACINSEIRYPRIVNFPITNKCTYKCLMCNVWKPEHSSPKDMSPNEIKAVFGKSLFKKVRHVGISGGEPFIRKDITQVVSSICEALPNLRSISIITNASLDSTVVKTQEIKQMLNSRGISFSLEVSVDGVGKVHDENRGCTGAFEKTIKNVKALNSLGLIDRISTTITKTNCNNLWEIYKFARLNNIPIKFRLASKIERLYNMDLVDNFTFTKAEKLRIIKFLENLIFYYEKNDINNQLFYTSLINQLKGGKRLSGCDWSTTFGVSLDPYGNLYFCFPKSKVIANINSDVDYDLKLLKQNQSVLKAAREECKTCTHDYRGTPDLPFVLTFLYEKYLWPRYNYYRNSRTLKKKQSMPKRQIGQTIHNEIAKVAIIGWYGTETLGDKAILGGIIDNLLSDGIKLDNITLVSLHPSYSELTLIEMGMESVNVVDTYRVKDDQGFISSQDIFIFGGGPLLDIEPLLDMMTIFRNAKKYGKKTCIYAAGIGPLKDPRYIQALNKMLSYTDRACFRDKLSIDKYKSILPQLTEEKQVSFIDPATNYIANRKNAVGETAILQDEYVLLSIRDWPYMYADGLSLDEYNSKNEAFKSKMAELIEYISKIGYKVVLMPMHNFYIGDDDREYYFQYIKGLRCSENITLIENDYTTLEAINYFTFAKFAICMRFHSAVFAVTCNTPCLAIDYHWGKGKIYGFMNSVELEANVISIEEFSSAAVDALVKKAENSLINWDNVNRLLYKKNLELKNYMSVNKVKVSGNAGAD